MVPPGQQSTGRRTAIADAAITLLAQEGSRRLTHRAVDRYLGMPEGSTSAYFRTRASLIAVAMTRLAELDRADLEQFMAPITTSMDAPSLISAIVEHWTTPEAAPRQLARLELQLESLRNPELAEVLTAQRAEFVDLVRAFVTTAKGATRAAALAPILTALVDGLIIDRLIFPSPSPSAPLDGLTYLLNNQPDTLSPDDS